MVHLLSYRHTIASESLFHLHSVLSEVVTCPYMQMKHTVSIPSSRGHAQPGRCNCCVPEKLPHERSYTVYPPFLWCSERLKSTDIFHRLRHHAIWEREAQQLQWRRNEHRKWLAEGIVEYAHIISGPASSCWWSEYVMEVQRRCFDGCWRCCRCKHEMAAVLCKWTVCEQRITAWSRHRIDSQRRGDRNPVVM